MSQPVLVPDTEGVTSRRIVDFLDLVFPPPRNFDIRLWDGQLLSALGTPEFTLVLRSPGSLRNMFRIPVELSLGEAYLRGDFDIEGDLVSAFALPHTARGVSKSATSAVSLVLQWLGLPRSPQSTFFASRGPALLSGPEHSRDRDRAAIQYHYDVGNDFYRLFLDRRMVYSCAYFSTPEHDLESAQEAKLEHICRKLRLRPGERILDIGCGWGALLIYAAERCGVEGVGVTLSEEQHRLALERVAASGLADRIRIERSDYRDLGDDSFDKIVSVGMFEHVGRDRFSEYFDHVFRLLRPNGLFLNHSIANQARPKPTGAAGLLARSLDQILLGNETFRKRYIFPDGELAPLSTANLQAEMAGFEVRDVENLREHYALTIRQWLQRLRDNRQEAIDLAGDAMFRLWEMYLAACIYHFDTARTNINQTLFAKHANGECALPLTRDHLYHLVEERDGRGSAPQQSEQAKRSAKTNRVG